MAQAALLVIDVQNIYAAPDSPLHVTSIRESIKNINALAEAFAKAYQPVIYVRHVHRADGRDAGRMFDFTGTAEAVSFVEGETESAYVPELTIVPSGLHITKRRYSSFEGTELDAILRTLGVDTVVITGYMTNFCCDTTARAAHDKDYFVDFIADATGAPALSADYTEAHIIEAVTTTLGAGFARIHTTADYLKTI